MVPGEDIKSDQLIPVKNEGDEMPEKKEDVAGSAPVSQPGNIDEASLKVFFIPSLRKTTKRIRISIEGDFTVRYISVINEKIRHAIMNYDYLDFTLKYINIIDLSAVQLMYVIKVICAREGKHVTIDAAIGNDDRALLASAGLTDVLHTPQLNEKQ